MYSLYLETLLDLLNKLLKPSDETNDSSGSSGGGSSAHAHFLDPLVDQLERGGGGGSVKQKWNVQQAQALLQALHKEPSTEQAQVSVSRRRRCCRRCTRRRRRNRRR